MKIRFHAGARKEFLEGIDFYNSRVSGLGEDFRLEIDAALVAIAESPQRWPIRQGEIRNFHTSKFPYTVLYVIRGDSIYFLAIMHQKRHPGYWKKRVEDLPS